MKRAIVVAEYLVCYILAACVLYAMAPPSTLSFDDYADTDEYRQRMDEFRERVEARGLDPDNL